jgi:hypothetical protein
MKKQNNTPRWVYLAFANVETRRGAYMLIWCNVLCSLYCIPWSKYFGGMDLVGKIFLIDNWYWFALMVPITVWYVLGLKWIDRNQAFESDLESA